ncbi:MAG: threonylcarbamoyl-AMP synthase [SAR202 cluster bacterium Casp-Chloro-G3]|nr:L-threonylcarbamoyladenylate synthase [Chloroflexota bacterium]PKB57543.1 MAG: threonylcarbamoyl-AMP synthase [SAR202 cluster bacterium Casp-Chloro-G3]
MTTPQSSGELHEALQHLTSGGVVVLPTDTLYGLAADVSSQTALERVFTIKGRASDLALPVLVSDWAMVAMVASNQSSVARRLAEKYWPGPLTLVLPKLTSLSDLVTGGRDTVAVRSPEHRVPQGLITQLGRPITGTSANLSGAPNPQSLDEVREQLGDSVDYIISCGPAPMGTASTIVDLTTDSPMLIREGAIPFQEIKEFCHSSSASSDRG